jgi:hypothetical protein
MRYNGSINGFSSMMIMMFLDKEMIHGFGYENDGFDYDYGNGKWYSFHLERVLLG